MRISETASLEASPETIFSTIWPDNSATLERKSIEPIALAVEDGNIRAMQHFISDALWDDDKIVYKYRNMVNEDLGDPDGVLDL